MEGQIYLGSERCIVRRTDGQIHKLETAANKDARNFAHQLLDFLGKIDLPDPELEMLWDSANSKTKDNILITSVPAAVWPEFRDTGLWAYFKDLSETAKSHIRDYFEKEKS